MVEKAKRRRKVYIAFSAETGELLWKANGHVEAVKKAGVGRATFFRALHRGDEIKKAGVVIDLMI